MSEKDLLDNDEKFSELSKKNELQEPQTALLIGAYQGNEEKKICEEHLDELERLAETLGFITLQKFPCATRKFEAATYLGKGKIEEIQSISSSLEPKLVIIDDEITPSQQRNLEKIFKIPVLDRTEVILEVFLQRAKTREARLQIELAKIKYELPRLKRLWTHLSRQKGGGVQSKGEGEKQIEIDRRLIKNRIERLQTELKAVVEHRKTQRIARERSEIPTFAIIGYTNAGKSTLLKALTDADVLVEDKLFATLDTTTRKFVLPNSQEILLIDTVGFIRKIPHTLVAAFRSTLEEAIHAEILLHLIDVSHPMAIEQAETTFEVLKELGAGKKTILTVLNKIDSCTNHSTIDYLRIKYSRTIQISALHRTGFDTLLESMMHEISKRRKDVVLKIPQSQYELVSEVMRSGKIFEQEYLENDILIKVEIPEILANRLAKFIVS